MVVYLKLEISGGKSTLIFFRFVLLFFVLRGSIAEKIVVGFGFGTLSTFFSEKGIFVTGETGDSPVISKQLGLFSTVSILFFEDSGKEATHDLQLFGCSGVGFERFEEGARFLIMAIGDHDLDLFDALFKFLTILLTLQTFLGALYAFCQFCIRLDQECFFGIAYEMRIISIEPGIVVFFSVLCQALLLLFLCFECLFVLLFAGNPLRLKLDIEEGNELMSVCCSFFVLLPIGGEVILLLHTEDIFLLFADLQTTVGHALWQLGMIAIFSLYFFQFFEGLSIISLLLKGRGGGKVLANVGELFDFLSELLVKLLGHFGIGEDIECRLGMRERILPISACLCCLCLAQGLLILFIAHLCFGKKLCSALDFFLGLLIFGQKFEGSLGRLEHLRPFFFAFVLIDFVHRLEIRLFALSCCGFGKGFFFGLSTRFLYTFGLCLRVAQGNQFLLAAVFVFLGFGTELVEINLPINGNNSRQIGTFEVDKVFFLQTIAASEG